MLNNKKRDPKKIKLIEDYEKIAAGEVIERPVSVVKELIENSLDADATRISIKIKNAGKDLIEVTDNGVGIPESQVKVAFQRHTSSKINKAEELDSLHTLGFRGEALASIAAVSKLKILTRNEEQAYATLYKIEGGEERDFTQSGGPIGTQITVRNLFYNLPVRKKFLKSKKVELGHISDLVGRYSLAYPLVHFKLEHNGLTLINSPKWIPKDKEKHLQSTSDLPIQKSQDREKDNDKGENLKDSYEIPDIPLEAYRHSIQTIYGKKNTDKMFPITYQGKKIKLYGHIGNPSVARSRKSAASLFVNKRLIKHKGISSLISDAYKDYLMKHRHPFYVLLIEIPPSHVDCNIHPSKKVVKFLNEDKFLEELELIIQDLIKKHFRDQFLTKTQKRNKQGAKIIQNNQKPKKKYGDTPIELWAPQKKVSNDKNEDKGLKRGKQTIEEGIQNTQNNGKKTNHFKNSNANVSITKNYQKELPTIKRKKRKPIQTHFKVRKGKTINKGSNLKGDNNYSNKPQTEQEQKNNNVFEHDVIPVNRLPFLKKLDGGIQGGQLYLVFQNKEELVIIDQHAAHERINYEKVQKLFKKNQIPIQELISPIKLEVPKNEVEFVKETIPKMRKFGFKIEFFGGNVFLVRSIPTILKEKYRSQQFIIDTCLEIIERGKGKTFKEIKKEIMQYIACHMSIVAGDEIRNENKIRKLIKDLDACENPSYCAHGRPTYIQLSYKDLDKRFHRT